MVSFNAVVLLAVSTLALAAPAAEKRWGGGEERGRHFWQPSRSSYIDFAKRYDFDSCECDVSKAQLPQAPTPLPAPAAGMYLYQVVIGRGTQNYTCDLSNSTAVPVPVGALASLFNATCIAANNPQLLAMLPGIALNLPVPSSSDASSPVNQDLAGHHYFIDSTTPYFNLDTSLHSWGQGPFSKISSANAPTDAIKGAFGQGNGAVAWLQLDTKDENCNLQQVYRVNTAGGNPPTTCQGQQAAFEVDYAAEYWIYSN